MNRRGFTLVEVIVTIAIIGIISGIAYGSITSLQTRNKQKKYKAYEQVMKTGAQLYVDQYSRDLWPESTSTTTYCITYDTLVSKGFIQAYNEKNEVIDTNSRVLVTRNTSGEASYKVYLYINSKGKNISSASPEGCITK